MNFDPFAIDLPVKEIIPEVLQELHSKNTLIVQAPPGAGKSTLLPLALLNQPFLKGKKILMLEPRRLATKSIALRMSELLGEKLGKTVGYRIRFESQVSEHTRLEVLTEGILTRMLHSDNALEDVGLVIFDEFHERNIHADVAMALCREAQQLLRSDLRILVMSATLDMPQLAALLNAPVISSEGKMFPVEINYTGDTDPWLMPEMVAKNVIDASKKHEGDILVFLPGQGEIKKTEAILKKQLSNFSIHPLYGQLSPTAQYQAIMPNKFGKRKVVLSTSIAETSLTIEGITVVIDSGFGRTSKFDPKSGLSKLETVRIAKDSADQRAGRAGRLQPGFCYRLWSKATQANLANFRTPEILEADLSFLVLDMMQWGIKDIRNLTWLTPPPAGTLAQAFEILNQLNAIENGKITPHGKQIHAIPSHPRIAHMLVVSKDEDKIALATDIAGLLEERDPLPPDTGVDINLRIEALRRARKEALSIKGLNKIEKIASNYRRLFKAEVDNSPVDSFETGSIIALAYPERIAFARPGNNAQFQLANGKLAMIGHKDDLAHESWLAISHIDAREGMGKVFLASPLNPKDLVPFVKEKRKVIWDSKKGGLLASIDLSIGSIVLRSTPIRDLSDSDLKEALTNALILEGEKLLDLSEKVQNLQARMGSLRVWRREENWPDWSVESIINNQKELLEPYLTEIRKPEDFKKLDLVSILYHSLSFEQQHKFNDLVPEKIKVPSGSLIKINYSADGEAPILAVRLQEVFGWLNTPKINEGRTSLLLHLLSPGFKPVQITSDLKSFWENTYFEVKKELKRRYPKHTWPEKPLEEKAIRGVKRKEE
ncbi:ATP-dependent helicase HrpB [Belliella baltica DSM 15883]|uniref:ATP-dependent helicase HrpB n=1 Tax=Belliella baltica (strain DSM 15883 / CIP 108006 / LMG 21964 / BA134) TaxID=866536 RepID=I3Z876_BELBD|nr:ATP-dependent helicase HrpB [Belliella baltica]AFL85444.1 ATP-dependent helicase HrpB [Belliella baltica DSM 15883]